MTNDGEGIELSSDIRVALDQFSTWADGTPTDTVQEQFATPSLVMPEGYELVMTSLACPEQYDMLNETGQTVGYFRLRGASYTVHAPECMGDLVFDHYWDDDPWKGSFDTDEERREFLQKGIDAVLRYHTDEWEPSPGEWYRCATCRWWVELVDGVWVHKESEYAPDEVSEHEAHWEKGRSGL